MAASRNCVGCYHQLCDSVTETVQSARQRYVFANARTVTPLRTIKRQNAMEVAVSLDISESHKFGLLLGSNGPVVGQATRKNCGAE
jgi:hypothetical protein